MTENKFRERRSAFREETDGEPAAAPLEAPAPPVAQEAEPETAASHLETDAAGEPAPDLDQLAGMDPPPVSFLELVEPHIEMALRFLGQLPLTPEGERRVLPQWAKREIDLLGLLEERTRGNLPPDERQILEQALDQLRTLYLKAAP